MKRFPFDDLHAEAGRPTILRLAQHLECSARTLHRWKNNGVPASRADEVAIRIGSHPAYIWPEHWDKAA